MRAEGDFGPGLLAPLDRNGKARVMVLARALMRRTEPARRAWRQMVTARVLMSAWLEVTGGRYKTTKHEKARQNYSSLK
jgi:hypothetical protein